MLAKFYEKNLNNMWLGLGRTQPWNDEEEPPAPNIAATNLDQLVGVKKVTRGFLVVPRINNNQDTAGKPYPPASSNDVIYKGQQWAPVSDKQASKYGARWLYLETDVTPEDLPYAVFRQTGIYMGLTPKPQFSNQSSLTPNEIQDSGMLIAYDNQRFQRYDSNIYLKESIVFEC